jgi:DAK2 domain fusion protein YloV
MVQWGARRLKQNEQNVNALNVFPVPDGDTGTNMSMTMQAGVEAMLHQPVDASEVSDLAKALSQGLLMGARGNSGVILSQLFRGFAKALVDEKYLTARLLAKAFERGVETAYRAVMKPVEGTVLTVAREAAAAGVKRSYQVDDPVKVMETVYEQAQVTLQKTPNLLPVLKETQVVDAGGQGLVLVYQGMKEALTGEEEVDLPTQTPIKPVNFDVGAHHEQIDPESIEHGYCTEFMVNLTTARRKVKDFDETAFCDACAQHGDSLLVVADEERVKVHIHAEHPGDVLNLAMQYGDLSRIKIDNMREQHAQVKKQKPPRQELGLVAIANGAGIARVFRSLGVDVVLEGGQTMNPSTDEIAQAIEQANAKQVIILPNNKNIILSAEQAAKLAERDVQVMKTRTIPQGLGAALAYQKEEDAATNVKQMEEASRLVRSGEVTYAVRDTTIDGRIIRKGEYLGIADGKIVANQTDLFHTTETLLTEMIDEDTEMVTLFYGQDVDAAQVKNWFEQITARFPDIEMEMHAGEQPVYAFVLAVE